MKKSSKKVDLGLTLMLPICYNTTVKQLRERLLDYVEFDSRFRFDSQHGRSSRSKNPINCLKKVQKKLI